MEPDRSLLDNVPPPLLTSIPVFNSTHVLPNSEINDLLIDWTGPDVPLPSTSGAKPAYCKRPDLSKFRSKFNGRTCVREFLLELEEYSAARDISPHQLFTSFSEVVTDLALRWYRSVRSTIFTWDRLRSALLKQFDLPSYDYHLENELRTKKQSAGETLSEFIIDMVDLSNRLTVPLPESIFLNIIKHNMHTKYSTPLLLVDVMNLDQLVALGKKLDESIAPPPPRLNTIRKPSKPSNVNAVSVPSERTCLKCKTTGHDFRSCNIVTGPVCFKCGARGNITKYCKVCYPAPQPSAAAPKNE